MDEFEKWLESLPDTHFRGMDEMEIAKEAFYAGKNSRPTPRALDVCPSCAGKGSNVYSETCSACHGTGTRQ